MAYSKEFEQQLREIEREESRLKWNTWRPTDQIEYRNLKMDIIGYEGEIEIATMNISHCSEWLKNLEPAMKERAKELKSAESQYQKDRIKREYEDEAKEHRSYSRRLSNAKRKLEMATHRIEMTRARMKRIADKYR